jgi:hypothetical protein
MSAPLLTFTVAAVIVRARSEATRSDAFRRGQMPQPTM